MATPRPSCAAARNFPKFCAACDPRYCTYDTHIEYQRNQPILGDAQQFCEAFFHISRTPELGTTTHWSVLGTDTDDCRMQCVTMVVRVKDFVARYTNCRRKHTEQLMAEDYILRNYLYDVSDTEMIIFLKFQPCHHSGGNARYYPEGYLFQGKCDSRSCCEVLLKFYREHLRPRRICLRVKIASLYKANWAFATRKDDLQTVQNARDGLIMLTKEGIILESMNSNDWAYLATLATNVTQEMLANPVTRARREEMDQFTRDYLATIKNA